MSAVLITTWPIVAVRTTRRRFFPSNRRRHSQQATHLSTPEGRPGSVCL